MKSVLVIGMGRFGRHLCMNMSRLGHQIMIVDDHEENLEEMLPYVVSAKIGDCTKPEVLKSLGIANFDLCFVCIGTNFQSSLEVTSQIKEMGGKYVISKATRDIQAKFLLRNGADEVIYPERDEAEKLAMRFSANHVYDYIELSEDYSIYEIAPPQGWLGKSLKELDIRNKYHINILGVKRGEKVEMISASEYKIKKDDHLMILGRKEDTEKILKQL